MNTWNTLFAPEALALLIAYVDPCQKNVLLECEYNATFRRAVLRHWQYNESVCNDVWFSASKAACVHVLKGMFDSCTTTSYIRFSSYLYAVRTCQLGMVQLYVRHGWCNEISFGLEYAVYDHSVSCVLIDWFLEQSFITADDKDKAVWTACRDQNVRALRHLLQHPQINPKCTRGDLLMCAIELRNVDMVQFLLAHGQYDPTPPGIMSCAMQQKAEAIVLLLLNDPRMQAQSIWISAMTTAWKATMVSLVRQIVQRARCDLTKLMMQAVTNNDNSLVLLLLRNTTRLNFELCIYTLVKWAVRRGEVDIMRNLLVEPRLKEYWDNSSIVFWAIDFGPKKILKMCVESPVVCISREHHRYAARACQFSKADLLDKYIRLRESFQLTT